MIRENDKIPPQALAVIVIASRAELNFIIGPREIAAAAGRDAWMGPVLSSILSIGVVWIIVTLMRRYPQMTLVEMSMHLLSRPVGAVLAVAYIGYWLARISMVLQLQSWILNHTLLPSTPVWVVSLYTILISTYLARHGIEPMSRLFLIFSVSYLLPLIVLLAPAIGGSAFDRFLPPMAEGALPILEAAWVTFSHAPGMSMLLMIGPFLKHMRGAFKAALVGTLLVSIPAIACMAILIARFGAEDVSEHVFPTLSLIELVRVPGFTGFRLDPLFLATWMMVAFTSIVMSHYVAAEAATRLTRLKENRIPVYVAALILAVGELWPVGFPDLLNLAARVRLVAVPLGELLLPALLLVVSLIRGAETNKAKGRSA